MSKRNGLPQSWKMSTIEDACSLVTDGTHNSPTVQDQGPFLYITSKNIRPFRLDLSTAGHVTRDVHAAIHRACPVEFGDVLFVKDGANTGNAAVNTLKEPFSLLSSVALLKPKKDTLEPVYLVHWLNCDEGYRCMTQNMSGSAIRRLVLNEIRTRRFPLPPLPEQRRIAAILEKADAIRRKREESIHLTEEVQRSTFLDMFGDPATHAVKPLADLAEVVSGVTKGRKLNGRAITVPYLRVANVQDGFLNLDEIKTIEALPNEVESLSLKDGDIVMTEGGDHDKLGRGAIWNASIPNCIHQNHVFRVRVDRQSLLPSYFAAFLRTSQAKRYFLRCAKKTTNLASINMTQLRGLPVPVPSIALQRKFEDAAKAINRIADRRKQALSEAVSLFGSLVQRAFRGEL